MNRIPRPALLLGWAGVLPFGALATATALHLSWPYLPGFAPGVALLAYGASILSFMAGAQWGLAMRSELETRWAGYAISVVPALIAWLTLLAPLRLGLGVQAVTFGALLGYDLWTVRRAIAPNWYGALRIQLTAAVAILLIAAAVAA